MKSDSSYKAKSTAPKNTEQLAFSMALDLLFNGQNMDYFERPVSLTIFNHMALFDDLNKGDRIAVIGPGGGRLVKTLLERGFIIDAFEGREECVTHLKNNFGSEKNVNIRAYEDLHSPFERQEMSYSALFNMDDLRAFRDREKWTDDINELINDKGYFIYSQVSNKIPERRNQLREHFKLVGNYNVSDETADQIRASYFGLDTWEPESDQYDMAKETLKLMKSASSLRRNILSGIEIRYFVWQKLKS